MSRGPKQKMHQLSIYVDDETLDMVNELCEALKSRPSAVFRQAVIRWWHSEESLLKSREAKKSKNGQPTPTEGT